jgi:hypothetical protein
MTRIQKISQRYKYTLNHNLYKIYYYHNFQNRIKKLIYYKILKMI